MAAKSEAIRGIERILYGEQVTASDGITFRVLVLVKALEFIAGQPCERLSTRQRMTDPRLRLCPLASNDMSQWCPSCYAREVLRDVRFGARRR